MQTSEREGCGPEVSPSTVPEATLESLPVPTKLPAFDLFNLVLSYKRLEVYLEPLKDAGDGVRYLLRYRFLFRVTLTCWAFCLPAFSCTGHLGSGWAVLSALLRSSSGRSTGPLGLFLVHPLSQTQPRRGRHWEPSGLSPEFLFCAWINSYPRTAT